MAIAGRCPRCGAELSDDAPQGLCAKCLLAAALEFTATGQVAPQAAPAPAGAPAVPVIPRYRILRLLGVGRRVPLRALVSFAVPWSIAGFAIAAAAGLSMFTAHAEEFVTQPVFLTKRGLIAAGGLNAALLHTGPLREAAWEPSGTVPARVRAAALLSLALWLGVIVCGRFLAYL